MEQMRETTKKDGPKRKAWPFRSGLEARLLAYTGAAAAAGVSVLALCGPVDAKVVYIPANQDIWANGGFLDLNNDGTVDFQLNRRTYTFHTEQVAGGGSSWFFTPVGNNAMRGKGTASALPSSVLLGPDRLDFNTESQRAGFIAAGFAGKYLTQLQRTFYSTRGPFANNGDRYLGCQFLIQGEIHYGWARLNIAVHAKNGVRITGTLTGYAYETIPNTPIFTGREFGDELGDDHSDAQSDSQPAVEQHTAKESTAGTLGHLAVGAPGLGAWRNSNAAKK